MAERIFRKEKCSLAAFDLDGTLIRDFALIPSGAVVKALKDLKESGTFVVLSSGRDLSQVSPDMLKCFSYAVLTNGSCVVDLSNGELIWSKKIFWLSLYRAIRIIGRFGGFCFLMQNGLIRGTEEGEKLVAATMLRDRGEENIIEGYSGEGKRYGRTIEAVNPFASPTYKVQAFFRDGRSCSEAFEALAELKDLSVITMFGTTLEITAEGVTKAAALDTLCERLGFGRGAYIAFGDSRNDLEMLEASSFAVAMENGEQCVKDIADYIAPPVDRDGVAAALHELYGI